METSPDSAGLLGRLWALLGVWQRDHLVPTETLVDAFVACEISRILEERDRRAWLAEELPGYRPLQTRMATGTAMRLVAAAADEVLGPFALLAPDDPSCLTHEFGLEVGLLYPRDELPVGDDFEELAVELGLSLPAAATWDNETTVRRIEWTPR